MSGPAIMAVITGNMMGCCYPVALSESGDSFSYFYHPSGYFMSQHQRGPLYTVPLHGVAAADRTGIYLHQQFTRPDFRNRNFFQTNILVIVVHCHTHRHFFETLKICFLSTCYSNFSLPEKKKK